MGVTITIRDNPKKKVRAGRTEPTDYELRVLRAIASDGCFGTTTARQRQAIGRAKARLKVLGFVEWRECREVDGEGPCKVPCGTVATEAGAKYLLKRGFREAFDDWDKVWNLNEWLDSEGAEDGEELPEPEGRYVTLEHCAAGDYCWLHFHEKLDEKAYSYEDGWAPIEAYDLLTGECLQPKVTWE